MISISADGFCLLLQSLCFHLSGVHMYIDEFLQSDNAQLLSLLERLVVQSIISNLSISSSC